MITDSVSSNLDSLQSVANSLHEANIFDVYAIGMYNMYYRSKDLPLIASDPSLTFYTTRLNSRTAQQLENNVINRLCSSELIWYCTIIYIYIYIYIYYAHQFLKLYDLC